MIEVPRATHPNPAPRRRARTVAIAVVGVVLASALMLAGFYAWRVWSTASEIRRDDTLLPSPDAADPERPAPAATLSGSFNYVLMGSDVNPDGGEGRSDVLMLAHVPPARDKVYVISFPRDMWVQIPGHGMGKINAAFAHGGPALTTRTIEALVGVRMDHAVRIDYDGFVGLTTELGGVTVDNRVESTKQGASAVYHWPAGPVTLQGEEALNYVRQRHGLPQGDLDRAERQRAMVRAILGKLMSRDVLADPARFATVMGALGKHVTVDAGLTNDALFAAASSMRVTSSADIVLLQAPLSGFGRSGDGQSIDVVNTRQLAEMRDAIRDGRMADYAAAHRNQPLVGNR